MISRLAGAVFLPAAGFRYGSSVYNPGSYGHYWSSTLNSATIAYSMYFYDSNGTFGPGTRNDGRNNGYSVRLVQNQ